MPSCAIPVAVIDSIVRRLVFMVTPCILFNSTSDHLPCIVALDIARSKPKQTKYVKTCDHREENLRNFYEAMESSDITYNSDILADPNQNYNILYDKIQLELNNHLPTRSVKFSKYKHKGTNWITQGIIRSIKFRDKLYQVSKSLTPGTDQQIRAKFNLVRFQSILKKNIRTVKTTYYANQFDRYKHDIRKTWGTIKNVLNNNKCKDEFPN